MIPPLNGSGVLPPYVGASPVQRALASPYPIRASALVQRFGTTVERIKILRGWLRYRAALKSIGVTDGVQWIDGSFVEDVEATRGRPPQDIDIVTFAARPLEAAEEALKLMDDHPEIFDSEKAKEVFHADAYFIDLLKPPALIVSDTAYFFGLFSHQRATALWKGMLQIDLNSDDDEAAKLLEGDSS